MRHRALTWLALGVATAMTACSSSGGADLSSGPRGGETTTTTTAAVAPTSVPPTSVGAGPSPTTVPPSPATTASTAPGTSVPPPVTPPPSPLSGVQIKLTRVATFTEPVAMAIRSGDGAFYIAEKRGRVRALRGSTVDPTPVLDIANEVSTGTEQGLLGLAFSPDGGKLYVNFTDTDGDTHIVEFGMAGGRADVASRREVLFVDQPSANHNGGNLVFGPDGRLWIGLGDGGGAGDPDDNAQNLNTLLGKILRIDPRPDIGAAYTVPGDNPFVGRPGVRPEIWSFGLRNPWRYSFDRATGDLWIGDVGQNAREEIDLQPAGSRGGQNWGWARLEGTRSYRGATPSDAVPPILDYGRAGGNCAVTGGYVYRGNRIPALVGSYVYGDYCVGQIQALRQSGGQVVEQRAFTPSAKPLTSFGQDAAGELYALSQDGGIFRIDAA